MLKKIKKLKFINLVLAACILSTTVAPSAQAMGLFNYLKKMISPSAQTVENTENLEVIAPSNEIVDISTATEEIGKESSVFNTRNAVRLLGSAIISGLALATYYFATKDFAKNKIDIDNKEVENNKLYENAPEAVIQEVKDIAKRLGFSEDETKKIKVKIDKKGNLNNYASQLNTVLIGRQTGINKYNNDNKIKFTFGHELTHMKQTSKEQIYTLLFGPILFSLIFYCSFNFESTISQLKSLKRPIKQPFSNVLFSSSTIAAVIPIIKHYLFDEKNADLGASKLGSNEIIGEIIFFEKNKYLLKKYEKNMENFYKKNSINKNLLGKFINFINKIKYILKKNLDEHPSDETRIDYLEKLLVTEEQKNKLAIERENLKKFLSEYEEVEEITREIFRKVNVKQFVDDIFKKVEVKQFVDETIKSVDAIVKSAETTIK